MIPSQQPDCYNCKYREQLGTTKRSWCNHTLLNKINKDISLEYRLSYHGYPLPVKLQTAKSEFFFVRFSQLGIQYKAIGWCFNFDPAFLLFCAGYTPKEKDNETNKTD